MKKNDLLQRLPLLLGLCFWLLLGGCEDAPTPKIEIAKSPKQGIDFQVPELSLAMLWCPPGTFLMGSPEGEGSRDFDETLREVTLTQGFWLGKHEVTQTQWEKIMGNNPSHFKGPDLPAEKMSWDGAKTFCKKLTERERKKERLPKGWEYKLPTEAHWEYACRAGTKTAWSFGNSPAEMPKNANFSDKSSKIQGNDIDYDDGFEYTAPVGSFPPNAWGFHDMHGNVFEWCSDWYEKPLPIPVRDPVGPTTGKEKVFRGGSWALPGIFMRSARRDKNLPILESAFLGFRVSLRKVQTPK
jgi:sulfatase modifying factor 1